MGRTVPATLEQRATRQLGRSPTNSPVCAQLLAQRNHQTLTIQITHGKRTKDDMGGEDNKVPISRPTTTRDERGKREGTRVYQTCATTNDRKEPDQVYALQERGPSLA